MPLLYLAVSLFVLSQSAIFIRLAEAPAAAIGFWRLAFALPVLLAMWWHRRKQIPGIHWKDFASISLCAVFLFLHWYSWVLSIQSTSAANAVILFCSNPIYVALGAWVFWRERIEWRHFIALLLCFLGIFWLVKDGLELNKDHWRGDLLGFISSVLFSLYVLLSKRIRKKINNIPFTFALYSLCAVGFFILAFVQAVPLLGYEEKSWAAFAALGLGSTLLGHSLFTYCLNHFNVNLMSVSTLTEPIMTAVSAYFLLQEELRQGTVIGFFFVSIGVLVLYFPYLRKVFIK